MTDDVYAALEAAQATYEFALARRGQLAGDSNRARYCGTGRGASGRRTTRQRRRWR